MRTRTTTVWGESTVEESPLTVTVALERPWDNPAELIVNVSGIHLLVFDGLTVTQFRGAPTDTVTQEADEANEADVSESVPSPALYASSVWVFVAPAEASCTGPTVLLANRSIGAACKEKDVRKKARKLPASLTPTRVHPSCRPRCSPPQESRERLLLPKRRTNSERGTVLPMETGRLFPHRRSQTGS